MSPSYLLLMVCGLAALWSTGALGQGDGPQCPPAEVHRFDFLIGDWRGQEYRFPNAQRDSVIDDAAVAHNRKTGTCQFEEHDVFTPVQGQPVLTTLIRSFDLASHAWMYSLIDGFVELPVFAGTQSDSGWAFVHDITTLTPPHRLRTQWVQTPTGYTEIMHVSMDSGRTWPVLFHVNFVRDRKP